VKNYRVFFANKFDIRLTRGLWSAYENGWIKGNCDTTAEILKKLLSFLKNFSIQRNIE